MKTNGSQRIILSAVRSPMGRFQGDPSRLTATGETRVLPEELEQTWEQVSLAWKQL